MSEPNYLDENRVPVISITDLAVLPDEDVCEGYGDGREGLPCGDNRSRAYWHGWRQGARDGGHRKGDDWDVMLTRAVAPGGRGFLDLPSKIEACRQVMRDAGLMP